MKKKREIFIFVLSLAVIIFLGLNANRFFFRIDMTENKAFTISRVSKGLFQEIPDRVFITYYISDRLRSLYTFPDQVGDLLHEYSAFSRGRIKVEIVDPLKAGVISDVEALGIYPQQIEVVDKNEMSYAQVYSGIVINYLDRYETIPFAFRVETLEYDLSSRIRQVVSDSERVVGLLSGDRSRQPAQDFGTLMQVLSGDFLVREIEPGQDIPDEVSVLFVLGSYDLDAFDLFPVDQFIMRGGRALFAVEGVKIDLMRGMTASALEEAPLLQMLAHYGVEVKRSLVLDRYCQNFRIPRQFGGQTMWQIIDAYPHWITVAEQFVSRENPVTARFSGLDLYWASPLELQERDSVQAQVLVQTTPEAWIMEAPFETTPDRVSMLRFLDHDSQDQYILAAALDGRLSSYFQEIPEREGEQRNWTEILPRSSDSRIIVIGDADFASQLYQYTNAAYNLEFMANSAEWLSNSEDLLEIKTRVIRDRRLNRIQDPGERLRAAVFAQGINLVLIPLLVIVFGITRHLLRRKKQQAEQEG